MNLNEPLGLDIAGEGKPFIKKPRDKDWSGTTLPWMSIGYEVKQTPLQILTFYNAVANGGRMVKPIFIKKIVKRGKVHTSFKTVVINESICSRSTIEKAKIMLESVIETGTARNLRNDTYKIAGKTGTVQIANEKYGYKYKGKYSYQASFVGYFPADKPKYSCIVVVNAPSNDVYYGNLVAGPIFKELADKVYASTIEIHSDMVDAPIISWALTETGSATIPYVKYGYQEDLKQVLDFLNIPADYQSPNSRWVVTLSGDSQIKVQLRKLDEEIKKGVVPNVLGMSAKDAVYLLENAGMKVSIYGGGMIVKQSVAPGSRINKGLAIELHLS